MALAFVILLLVSVTALPYWAVGHEAPVGDAGNCVARASNLGLRLQHGQFGPYWSDIRAEPNNFLSVLYFGGLSLLFGPGRAAWGWGWAAMVALWFATVCSLPSRESRRAQLCAASTLFFACAPLVFRPGGLLDERFDPLAALLTTASAAFLTARQLGPAAGLSLLAVLAKGPALPLNLLLWLSAFASGVVTPGLLRSDIRQRYPWWAAFAGAAAAYGLLFLPAVTAYNLMAVPAPTIAAKVGQLVRFAPEAAWRDRWFYASAILRRAPFMALLVAGGLGAHLSFLRIGGRTRRVSACGLLLAASTYLLFSAHPVRDRVLIVWFAPCAWLLAVACTRAIPAAFRWISYPFSCLALAFQLIVGVFGAERGRDYFGQPRAFQDLRQHVDIVAQALEDRDLAGKDLVLLVNFAFTADPSLAYTYDTYRVMLFESMGRRAPRVEGWELGTFTDDWRRELDGYPPQTVFLTILAVNGDPSLHHRGRAAYLARSFTQAANPACEVKLPVRLRVPRLGRLKAYLTRADLQTCVAGGPP